MQLRRLFANENNLEIARVAIGDIYDCIKRPLDWELMNKLCELNENFETFIDNVRKDYEVKTIHSSEFDRIEEDPGSYIEKKLGVKQDHRRA